jgi:hypothetical protein
MSSSTFVDTSLGYWYPKEEDATLKGFSYVDYGGYVGDCILIGAYLFTIGKTPMSWHSKK